MPKKAQTQLPLGALDIRQCGQFLGLAVQLIPRDVRIPYHMRSKLEQGVQVTSTQQHSSEMPTTAIRPTPGFVMLKRADAKPG